MSTTTLFLSILFGSIGFGYAFYGKRRKALTPFFCGLALMAMPYFIGDAVALVAAGVVCMAIPYWLRS